MPLDVISYLEALKSRKLSSLIIDTDKDWGGKLIKNLGDPIDPNDVVRKIYVDLIVATFNITYYLLNTQDTDVPDYKEVSLTPADTGVNYTEVSSNTAGEVYVDGWISPTGATPSTIVAGTYILTVQAEKVSGNIDVRLFFRLYERRSDGTEVLIGESNRTNLFREKAILTCSMILVSDYTLQSGSRLVLKVYVEYASGGSNTTVRVYYKGDTASRFAMPSTKEVLDTLYAQRLHASQHGKGGEDELSLDASQITSGVLSVDRIPDLSRSKITDFFSSPFWDNIPDKPSYFPSKASLFTFDANIIPDSDNAYSIGSASVRIANIHVVQGHIYAGSSGSLRHALIVKDLDGTERFGLSVSAGDEPLIDIKQSGVGLKLWNRADGVRANLSCGNIVCNNITPALDNTYDIGSASARVANIYGYNFYASGKIVLDNVISLQFKDTTGTVNAYIWMGGDDVLKIKNNIEEIHVLTNYYLKLLRNDFPATSTNTLVNSATLRFTGAYWDGSKSVARHFDIQHRMIDTSPKSELVFTLAGDDILRIREAAAGLPYGAVILKPDFELGGYDGTVGSYIQSSGSIRIDIDTNANQSDRVFRVTHDGNAETLFEVNEGKVGKIVHLYPLADNTYNLGSSSLRWANAYIVNLYTGDINLDNGWKITELPNGVIIKNAKGEEIFRITEEGVWFKGKKIV